jgi:hypothetical protein
MVRHRDDDRERVQNVVNAERSTQDDHRNVHVVAIFRVIHIRPTSTTGEKKQDQHPKSPITIWPVRRDADGSIAQREIVVMPAVPATLHRLRVSTVRIYCGSAMDR